MISPEDESAIRRLGSAWDEAWNKHDMHALALLVTENVDFIHVAGGWLGGREAFARYHAERHATIFKTSVTRTEGMAIRPLTQDICLVHRNWSMVGDTGRRLGPSYRGGTPSQPRDGIITWIVRRDGSKWLIDAAHNTNIVREFVGPEHRKPTS
jgi:uncharacterized protein (TIGR02246 family)